MKYRSLGALILTLCLQALLTQAQDKPAPSPTTKPPEKVRIGLLIGPQINRGSLKDVDAIDHEKQQDGGAAGGILVDIPFGRWAVQPGFLYSSRGFSERIIYRRAYVASRGGNFDTETSDISHDWNCLEVPVNFVFTTGRTRGLQLLAGPFFAALLNARQRANLKTWQAPYYNTYSSTELTGPLKLTNDVQPDDLRGSAVNFVRSWDAGFQIGGGYSFGRLGLRLTSSWGLRNLAPKQLGETTGNKIRSHSVHLGVFCLFGAR